MRGDVGALIVLAAVLLQTSLNIRWTDVFAKGSKNARTPYSRRDPAPETIATLRAFDLSERQQANKESRVFSTVPEGFRHTPGG